jgi:hypothetical protein
MAIAIDGRVSTNRAAELAAAVLSGSADADETIEAAESLRALAAERDVLRRMDSEAATHVESVIAMRTDFTGDTPYVGWRGLGLSLREALDERDALRTAAGANFPEIPEAYRGLDLSAAQRLGLEAMAAVRSHPSSSSEDSDDAETALDTERRALASVVADPGGDRGREAEKVLDMASWVGRCVAASLAARGFPHE